MRSVHKTISEIDLWRGSTVTGSPPGKPDFDPSPDSSARLSVKPMSDLSNLEGILYPGPDMPRESAARDTHHTFQRYSSVHRKNCP